MGLSCTWTLRLGICSYPWMRGVWPGLSRRGVGSGGPAGSGSRSLWGVDDPAMRGNMERVAPWEKMI